MKRDTCQFTLFLFLFILCLPVGPALGQSDEGNSSSNSSHYLSGINLSGLKFRCVGPALTSGRIADIAVNPAKTSEYYVATASGGVWKTVNAGTTFEPLFDRQGSYSIGCVTMDPNNPNVVWVGSGENNNQRSVGYGDGVYKSEDGGQSWENVGLKQSEHIGKIIVDPHNSEVIYVAAIGPLWSEGGERGVYKSVDGGENWEAVLTISKHTGVNDLVMDPRDPNVLYATSFQRRRHVFTYLGGGPESGIWKTSDGGKTWKEINNGLPGGDRGRIALAISPADPEIIYAIVEAAQGKGGFFRSTNRGASWEKRSGHSTSGNYYQEIIPDPVNPDVLYSMDTWFHVTTDGGKSFSVVGEDTKHVDNHSMWIDPGNTSHWLIGCDGGIYETWDAAKTWNFKANLPVTQFYKVAVDNSEPFYYIYGGTQDNFTLGGPSRTISNHGIINSDWFITRGGDGFETQIDPDDPNIVYSQSQYGVLYRYDRRSGEEVGIKPKERKGENAYRWNWDAPLATSHHRSGRLYFAANKLFRSDDRGNSWEVISEDLTRQINRNELEVMDRIWGIDAVSKHGGTSPYGAIVAFSESPIDENLLFVGTDDGLIQVTPDGGQTWHKITNFPGVPDRTYVNAVYASQHSEEVVYAAFNHHKNGDFKPYLYKSSDRGRTWSSISNGLPERGSVYSIEEDHLDPGLLFTGTEFGVYFSNDGGQNWMALKAGLPTIAVRDLAIQRRENDLVLGTFGRGFYVLDDYSPLRRLQEESLAKEAVLFTVRDPWMYEESMPLGLPGKSFQGDSYYSAQNLGPEALIRYYLAEDLKSLQQLRRDREKELAKEGAEQKYPSYQELKAEREQQKPTLMISIADAEGQVIRKLMVSTKKGLHTVRWDLRFAPKTPVKFDKPGFYNAFAGTERGTLVAPGLYTATLAKVVDGEVMPLYEPVSFNVKALNNTTLPAPDRSAKVAFQREVADLQRAVSGAQGVLRDLANQLKYAKEAVRRVELPLEMTWGHITRLEAKIREVRVQLNGDPVAWTLEVGTPPSISQRVGQLVYEQSNSTAAPTKTHQDSYAIAKEAFGPVLEQIQQLQQVDMVKLQQMLEEAGAPYTPGRKVELGKN